MPTTQFITKMNKTEAGFHLLMTLSLADGSIHKAESSVILEFLEKNYKEPIEIIKEQAFLRACPEENLMEHFIETAEQFFKISKSEERNKLIAFAMKVVMADNKMENAEDSYINVLYDTWGLD
ncbi:MAG: TerB family tellurite resistance protein [Bacteroidia bacterium]|nr:TerB family tellurite resistance protein [Bacteroidia bacterium]